MTNYYAADAARIWSEAVERVTNDPELNAYRDIIIDTDWPQSEHMQWVATAEKADILDWADAIRRGLDQHEPDVERW